MSYRSIAGEDRPYELNCTYLDLITPRDDPADTTVDRFVASQAIALSMPGVPAVYIQSMLATRNDHDGVRSTGRARSINRSQHDLADIETAISDETSLTARVFAKLKQLITVRARERSFSPYADFDVIDAGKDTFVVYRNAADDDGILAIINLTGDTVACRVPGFAPGSDILTGNALDPNDLSIAAYEVLWIRSTRK